jgi:hypothetical protein
MGLHPADRIDALGCIVRPATTLVNYVNRMKIAQYVRRLGLPLTVIFPRAAQPIITDVAPCHRRFETHALHENLSVFHSVGSDK